MGFYHPFERNDSMKNHFDKIAHDYDEDIYPLNDPAFVTPTVEAIESLAPGKKILEFGVGTGRIALPLAKKGFDVTGVDISPKMLTELKIKAGETTIQVHEGEMSSISLNEKYDLAYCIFNGISYLLTLAEQVAFLKNASRHLNKGGIFLLETFIPRVEQILKDDTAPYALEEDYLGFDKYNRIEQLVTSYQFDLSSPDVERFESTHRYVWPSELELMGQLAGMELLHRWGEWDGEPLSNESANVIMVWRKTNDCS